MGSLQRTEDVGNDVQDDYHDDTTISSDSNDYRGLLSGWESAQVAHLILLFDMRTGICAVALVINLVVFAMQMKVNSFRRTQYIFPVTLTIADIIHAAALVGETYLFRQNIFPIPFWYGAFASASTVQSYFSISAVAYDRYLALCAIPLKYKQVVTIRKYCIVIFLMSVTCLTFGFASFGLVSHQSVILTYASFAFPAVIMTMFSIVYIRLGYLVSKSLKQMKLTADVQRRRAIQTRRLMITFATILAANIICNVPQRIYSLYISLQPVENRYTVFVHMAIGNWFYNVQTINTCVNPIIYWKHVLSKDIKFPSVSTTYRVICPKTCHAESPDVSKENTKKTRSTAVPGTNTM